MFLPTSRDLHRRVSSPNRKNFNHYLIMVELLSILWLQRRKLSKAQINKYLLTMFRKICKEVDRKPEGQVSNRTKVRHRGSDGLDKIWSLLTVGEIVRGVADNVIIIVNRVTGITTRYESVWYVCREVVTDRCLAWVMAEPFCNTLLGDSRHAILEAIRASLEVILQDIILQDTTWIMYM